MKKQKKIILYSILCILGITIFCLQLFVFESPDGVFGFLLCLTSIYLIFGSIYKLCKLSKKFLDFVISFLDTIF